MIHMPIYPYVFPGMSGPGSHVLFTLSFEDANPEVWDLVGGGGGGA